jgi:hypothetical protein
MMIPLESVRLKAPIDSHDQRNQVALDERHGWECALDTDLRVVMVRHKESWTAEVPLENVAHYKRAEVVKVREEWHIGRDGAVDHHALLIEDPAAVPLAPPKPKGRKR